MGVVHQLVEQTRLKGSPSRPSIDDELVLREADHSNDVLVVRARCGAEQRRPARAPLPEDMSGWHSDVTCAPCLERQGEGAWR